VTGVGTALTWLVSGIWLPRAFASQAETYGLIGVFIVVVSWFILLALLLVLAAVISAELWSSASPHPAQGTTPPRVQQAGTASPTAEPFDAAPDAER